MKVTTRQLTACLPGLILLAVLAPVLAGLIGAVLPATGWFPPLGGQRLSGAPLTAFLAEPGLVTSVMLSVFTALTATSLSYLLAMGLLAVLVVAVLERGWAARYAAN